MNSLVIKYLQNKGYKNLNTDYYNYVNMWEQYWKNDVDYMTYYDDYKHKHTLFTLGMAKRICEDWGSIVCSEHDDIVTDKEQNKNYIERINKELKLKTNLPKCVEVASWSGTCGAIIRLKNIVVKNGVIQKSDKTRQELIKVSAKNVIPLTIENDSIKEVAFVSDSILEGKGVIYIELHELEDDGYKISNIYLDKKTGKEIFNDEVLGEFKTKSFVPLFSLLMPPKTNSIDDNMGLGMSIYADALPQIQACDITYNNFVMDYYLGGKKVFYNKKIVGTRTVKYKDSEGNEQTKEVPVYPDDVMKQQWKVIDGDMSSVNDTPLYHEYNPTLRIAEDKDGVQFALDTMAFKSSLGTKYYQFNGSTVVTATQYMGDRQDLVQNAKKFRDRLNEFTSDIVKASLLIGRTILGENVTEDCNVEIENVDGFLADTETLKQEFRQEIATGVRKRYEYRMKFFGEDEETAKKKLAEDINSLDLE